MHTVATAGHVDHGKSALVRCLTGVDPDRLPEEKARGLSIDLGFALCQLPSGREFAFIDVPGHLRFVRNMIAGVGSVDACLLVIDAREGWKPQTEEHFRILSALGLHAGLVVASKCEAADKEERSRIMKELSDRVTGSFLEEYPVVLTDAVTREGIDGATGLISLIDTMLSRVPTQKDMGRPRLWIDRSFAIEGVGTVVTGTLAGGTLEVGQSLVVEPGSRQVSIRGLQTHGTALAVSPPGRRLAVNLRGVHFSEIKRGQALVREGQWNHCESFDGELNVFPGLGHGVSNKGAYVACIGSGAYQGRIACLGATHEIPAGGRGHIRVWLQEGLPLCSGDRFVLRESGRQESVGGGTILEIMPKRPIRKTVPTSDVNQLIAMHGWIDPDELFRISGVRVAPNVGSWIVDPGTISATQSKLAAKLAANPLGIETIELDERERLMVLSMPNVEIHRGVAFQVGLPEPPFHPYLEALRANPYIPPPPTGVDSRSLRLLERRGLIVHSQDIWFARSALRSAAAVLRTHSMKVTEGLTVSEVRMVLKTSRRYALAILGWMDLNGWTQRTGDERSLTELAETQ